MGKLPKTKEEIEQLVLSEMLTIADCEHALAVPKELFHRLRIVVRV
jgi:hypothetical protein